MPIMEADFGSYYQSYLKLSKKRFTNPFDFLHLASDIFYRPDKTFLRQFFSKTTD